MSESSADPATRAERLRSALAELAPVRLDLTDDSHRHRNHPGAADGRGHFKVHIVSERFVGLSRIKRHQLVYAVVGDLMQTDIHALQVVAKTPDEAS